jgi:hypothetical protein
MQLLHTPKNTRHCIKFTLCFYLSLIIKTIKIKSYACLYFTNYSSACSVVGSIRALQFRQFMNYLLFKEDSETWNQLISLYDLITHDALGYTHVNCYSNHKQLEHGKKYILCQR